MTVLMSLLAGAGVMLVLSVVAAVKEDSGAVQDLRDVVVGTLAAPVLLLGYGLRNAGWFAASTLSPQALERFTRMRRADGSQAFALYYGRHGVIWVRGLKVGEAVPPRRVLRHDEVFGGNYVTVKTPVVVRSE